MLRRGSRSPSSTAPALPRGRASSADEIVCRASTSTRLHIVKFGKPRSSSPRTSATLHHHDHRRRATLDVGKIEGQRGPAPARRETLLADGVVAQRGAILEDRRRTT